jgi:hypothetical protein
MWRDGDYEESFGFPHRSDQDKGATKRNKNPITMRDALAPSENSSLALKKRKENKKGFFFLFTQGSIIIIGAHVIHPQQQ